MTKFATLLLTLILCSSSFATAGNYYDRIDDYLAKNTVNQKKFRSLLNSTITGHIVLTYKEARSILFGQLHLEQSKSGEYYIEDVYCEAIYDNGQNGGRNSKVGVNRIPNNNIINCEHTWPKSRFGMNRSKKKGPGYRTKVSDLHHLFPTDSKLNGIRGNFEFGEVDYSKVPLPCSQNRLGKIRMANGELSKRSFFEPPVAHRGNIARALFYFAVRYQMPISKTEESFLRKWHREDPVDEVESLRNDKIYKIQKNRNPFIDNPEYVELITDF